MVKLHPSTDNLIADIYGKYGHPYNRVITEGGIDLVAQTHKMHLKYLGIEKESLNNMSILECGGTGRDALAWARLGAGDVTHIEISKENVNRLMNYAKANKVTNLKVIHSDILTVNLDSNAYDIVRSRGVVHHLGFPGLGIARYSKWVKKGGYIHFNLYRGGTFYYYGVKQMRRAIKSEDLPAFIEYIETARINGDQAGILIDDLFVPTMHNATHALIKKDLTTLKLEIIWPLRGFDEVNHSIVYPDLPEKHEHLQYWVRKNQPHEEPEKISKRLIYHKGVDDIELARLLPEARISLDAFEKFIPLIRNVSCSVRAKIITQIYLFHHYELSKKAMSSLERHKRIADFIYSVMKELK